MKTAMHENSLAAYDSLNLSKARKRVLAVFVEFPSQKLTDQFVAAALGWDINRVMEESGN